MKVVLQGDTLSFIVCAVDPSQNLIVQHLPHWTSPRGQPTAAVSVCGYCIGAGLLAENVDLPPVEQKCLKNIKFCQLLGTISYF